MCTLLRNCWQRMHLSASCICIYVFMAAFTPVPPSQVYYCLSVYSFPSERLSFPFIQYFYVVRLVHLEADLFTPPLLSCGYTDTLLGDYTGFMRFY